MDYEVLWGDVLERELGFDHSLNEKGFLLSNPSHLRDGKSLQ